jgi:hypothetical protein
MVGLLVLVVAIATVMGLRSARRMVDEFTDKAPAPLPEVRLSPSELDALRQRVSAFQQAVRQERASEPLRLTSDEVNALILTSEAGADFQGRVYVTLQSNQPAARLSLPLSQLGLPVFRQRFFNGTARFEISLHDGFLRVSPVDLRANGKPLPSVYMGKIRKLNLAEKVNADPRAPLALEKLESIKVEAGQLVITPAKPK